MRQKNSKNVLKFDKRLAFISLSLLTILLIIFLTSFFRATPSYHELNGFTLGTYCRIVVSSKKNSKVLAEIIFNELDRVYKKYNPNDPASVVSRINGSTDWIDVDEETFVLLDVSIRFSKITNGAFDPALGNLIQLWGFDKIAEKIPNRIPTLDEINRALQRSGVDKVELDHQRRRIRLLNGAKLDLGGIAKGYALDRAYQVAKEVDKDCTGFVEAGGDIRILGPKFGSRPWVIGVRDPRKPDTAISYLYLTSGAVATSGDYERYFELNGIRYHHILNPKTGFPAKGAISVTVVADNAVTADALSTAGFVMGQDWEFVVLEFPKFGGSVLLVEENGTIRKSSTMVVYEQPK
ncbi:FAD:protein FMN transferase [Pseudothermotoga sp.]|nr:FAD:protein FMN transferase [Pseudothermotoga sp.]MCX7812350.1 FAD:protein FMN transferase [Pseudothermotoga sp.]MDW8139420.1 FAD:protein FMN transferase [Pseudothermotoga sp.]